MARFNPVNGSVKIYLAVLMLILSVIFISPYLFFSYFEGRFIPIVFINKLEVSNQAIVKIEEYRNNNGVLPNDLAQVGFKFSGIGPSGDPIFYEPNNNGEYKVFYGEGFDYGNVYESRLQSWSDTGGVNNGLCNSSLEEVYKKVNDTKSLRPTAIVTEKNILGIPSEGTNVKLYSMKDGMSMIEVASFASLARFFTNYYLMNGEIFFIETTTDEWDLEKLHGKYAELSVMEGEFVVATSTKESFVIENNVLCKYVAQNPRLRSAAVMESRPVIDAQAAIEFYYTYVK